MKKKLRATAAVVALAYLGVCVYFLNSEMEGLAASQQETLDHNIALQNTLAQDKTFLAVSDRIVLDESHSHEPIDHAAEAEEFVSSIADRFPYKILPGYQSIMKVSAELDANDQKVYADKTISKAFALADAKRVCTVVKRHTPETIGQLDPASNTAFGKDNAKKNLPVYLDYCNVTDPVYRDAIIKAAALATEDQVDASMTPKS